MVLFWLVLGLGLIGAELFLPGLVAGSLGLAGLFTAGVAWLGWPALAQMAVWIGLSSLFTVMSRRLVPRSSPQLEESREARSLDLIPAGQRGRVAYLGSTWNARCHIPNLEIQAGQELYVVERQGNTLLVMPSHLLHS
jgi:membrane protein implicated in regulation of membrane protease activity